MADNTRKLVLAILRFLQKENVSSKYDVEHDSMDVAIECLSNAYRINLADPAQLNELSSNISIEALLEGLQQQQQPQAQSKPKQAPQQQQQQQQVPAEKKKEQQQQQAPQQSNIAKAEAFKVSGNDLLKKEDYLGAIDEYTKAIELNPTAIYYANRAAAQIKLNNIEEASEDCERSVKLDPGYAKAFYRLGQCKTLLERHGEAYEAYKKALDIEPDNGTYQEQVDSAKMKLKDSASGKKKASSKQEGEKDGNGDDDSPAPAPPQFNMGNLGQLLSDPSFQNMANSFMSNPSAQSMINQMISGNGGDLGQLAANFLSNPAVGNLFANLGGGPPPGAPATDGDPNEEEDYAVEDI